MTLTPDAFFVADGDRFVPTLWTRGPWDPTAQHAGPPAALVARTVASLDTDVPMQIARFTFEVFRPIPLVPLTVTARIVRPGRRVRFVEASLHTEESEVARASAWQIRTGDRDGSVDEVGIDATPYPDPEGLPPMPLPDLWEGPTYLRAMEWRAAAGAFLELGPAAVWMRMRVPLVEGEEPSPLTRVLAAADSGNGISNVLPFDRFLFVNLELSVHLVRMPEGPWVCLDATTRIDPRGVGLAQSVLWDTRGRIGGGDQTLLVALRSRPEGGERA